jgi:AraC-like DNA-binding protein
MTDAAPHANPYADIRRTGPGVTLQIDHSHPGLEINLIIAGRGTYFLADSRHDLVPGTLVWLLPDQSHRLLRTPELDMWVIEYPRDRCDAGLLADAARNPAQCLSREDAIALDHLMAHVSQDSDEPALYQAGVDYVVRSARHYGLTSPAPAPARLHPAVLAALAILRDETDAPSTADLARRAGVSQDYLGQLLVEQTGRGLVEWRNRMRLERFHVVYPQSGDLLTAALAAGFGSYTQFHRVFADLVGTTPGDWARSGSSTRTAPLPSANNLSQVPDHHSARMIWYPLAEVAVPDAGRWLPPGFAAALLAAGPTDAPGDAPPLPSGIAAIGDLRRFEAGFVDELQARDAENAARLARAFATSDILHRQYRIMQHYGVGIADLAEILAVYILFAFTIANGLPTASQDTLQRLAHRVRQALANCGADPSPADRQRAAAALITQAAFLHFANVAARASGKAATGARLRAAARATALATLALDLTEARLLEPRTAPP